MKDYKVSIIIPNYNGEELLRKNLPRVMEAAENSVNHVHEVIIVDDGSKDGSVKLIKKEFPKIRLIKHRVNRGFSSAVNTGVRSSKGNLIALLNNDVYPAEDFLKASLKHFKDDRVFAVSFHTRGFTWVKGAFKDGFIVYENGDEGTNARETFFANAGGAIYKKSVWKRLNGMDEALYSPFYWEDVDISYGALKRGYLIVWEPDSYVSPNLSATIEKMPRKWVKRIQERNHLLFVWKNLTSQNLFRKHITELLKRMVSHPGYIQIVIMAALKLPRVVKARRKERKESKLSDEAIFARF